MTYDQELLQEILWELREIKKKLPTPEPVQVVPKAGMKLTPAQIQELTERVQRALLRQQERSCRDLIHTRIPLTLPRSGGFFLSSTYLSSPVA